MSKPTRGYKGFGSFHSENVKDLLASAIVPSGADEIVGKRVNLTEFGEPAREAFLIDFEQWTFLNHGAFGGACKVAMNARDAYSHYMERNSLRFIDRELFPLVIHSIKRMAALVHGDPARLVFCPNATTAINAVVQRSIKKGDVVFCLDIAYGSVKTLLKEQCQQVGASLHLQPLDTKNLTSKQDIINQVKLAMPSDCTFAVFDHVASNTAIVMPIRELIQHAHALGAKVLIDGAHGLGSLDLYLDELGAEWYASNCHKWLSSTKGVGILYVQPAVVEQTRPLIVSHGWNNGFTEEWIWDGTRDYAGQVAMPLVLDWWESVPGGLAGARNYCQTLLLRATRYLTCFWGTQTHVDASLYSHMACVEIPQHAWPFPQQAANSEQAKIIQDTLHYIFKIECPVKVLDGSLCFRISAQIYNTMSDYEKLAEAVNKLKWQDGEFIQ